MAENQIETSPPEKPKKSSRKWWLIGGCGCLILIVLIGLAVGLGGFGFYKALTKPVGPIKAQLEALNKGDYEKAYSYCSKAFKEATSFENFESITKENPQIFKSKKSSFSQVSIEGGVATVSGSITGQDGTVTPMVYKVVKEGGEWKILGFQKGAIKEED